MKELLHCVSCGKPIWRNKLKTGEVDTLGRNLCQICKNKARHEIHKTRNKVYKIDDSIYNEWLKQELIKLSRKQKLEEKEKEAQP
jgi:hypothetical protein